MRRLTAIAGREFASYFRTPLGWVVIALFVCLSSIFFVGRTILPGAPASMEAFFQVWLGLILFLAPAVSMRLFSEELRTGTFESVMTAPVREGTLVAGKFLASVLFLLAMLLPSAAYVGLLEFLSRPDYGPILSGYLGLLLLGMLYLSVGALASSVTSSQTLAFLLTLFALLALDLLPAKVAPLFDEPYSSIVANLSPSVRARDFSRGLIDTSKAAYFLAATFWFLTVAGVCLQTRRWR